MELALGIVAVALLACVACGLMCACRYYVSGYARATKRDFSAVMRDPHAREVYRTSRRLVSRDDDDTRRVLFDVAVPRENASAAYADIVLFSRQGVGALCVQEGRGSVYGDPEDEHWVMVGSGKGGDTERITVNLGAQVAAAADALRSYLLIESDSDACFEVAFAACAVFGDAVKMEHIATSEDVAVTRARDVSACLGEVLAQVAAPPLDEGAVRKMYRALKPCANAGSGAGLDGFEAPCKPETAGWARSLIQRERGESASAELMRKADKLASSKEDFDALTWDRILDICDLLERERDPERLGELAAELRLIARTNVSLNYRFGITQPHEGATLSPAGLVMQSSFDAPAAEPDVQLHEALESTDFFDRSSEANTLTR